MEEDQAVEANVTKQFYFLVRNLEMEHSFPTIRPVPKGPAPLQIADMIAYEGSRHFSEQIIAKSARPPRRLYLELKACQSLQFGESATAERVKDTTDRLMKAERQIREEDPDVDAQWAKNI